MKFFIPFVVLCISASPAYSGDRLTEVCASILSVTGVSAAGVAIEEIAPNAVAVSFLDLKTGSPDSFECWFVEGANQPILDKLVLDRSTGLWDVDTTAYANSLLQAHYK